MSNNYNKNMKYILIANNNNIDEEINKLDIKENDEIVLFNFMKPFYKYEKIKNAQNITVFSRKRSSRTEPLCEVYAGLNEIKENYEKIKKIIFHQSPDSYRPKIRQACIDALKEFNFLHSNKLNFINAKNYKKLINFDGKALSSGLIAYIYYKITKRKNDQIFLVGFTHSIAQKYHDPEFEKNFFKQEIENNNCFNVC